MASIKAMLFTYKTLRNGEHPIVIQIIKDRKRKMISLGHSCHPNLWDFNTQIPLKKHPNYSTLKMLIESKKLEANKLNLIFENEQQEFTLSEFEKKFKNRGKKESVTRFIDTIVSNLVKTENIGNSNVYKDLKRELIKFIGERDFYFTEINYSFLRRFEQFFREKQIKETSISVYFRTLRSAYNKAIKEGYAKKETYPFHEYKISKFNTQTAKRALTKEDMKLIIDFPSIPGTSLFHSKNFFVFSFYTMGMNFSDISKLEWSNIDNDRVYYIRSKTGKNYNIKLLPPVIEILNHYRAIKTDKYVFPILNENTHKTAISIDNRIEKMNKQTNSDLKDIGKKLEIQLNLTTYVARHSWATILKRSGVSTSQISEGLGHDTEKTTQTYLDSFENETMDKANEILLSL